MYFQPKVLVDFICVLYIVAIHVVIHNKIFSKDYQRDLFCQSGAICIVFIADALSYLLDGRTFSGSVFILTQIISIGYIAQVYFFFTVLIFEIKWCINKKKFTILWSIILPLPVAFEIIIMIINEFTGDIFFVDTHSIFNMGHLYFLYHIPLTISLVELIIGSIIGIIKAKEKPKLKENSKIFLVAMLFPTSILIPGVYPMEHIWVWPIIAISVALIHLKVYQNLISKRESNNAISALGIVFLKILKINLHTNTYEVLKSRNSEKEFSEQYCSNFIQSIEEVYKSGLIHPEDREVFRQKFEYSKIQETLLSTNTDNPMIRTRYRRKSETGWRWVKLEIIRSTDFTPETPLVMLMVSDIHDEFIADLEEKRKLENLINYDLVSGVHSRYSYYETLNKLKRTQAGCGIVFSDLNRLKFINEEEGHEAGDNYIRKFAQALNKYYGEDCVYRISGDEFIVLYETKDEQNFRMHTGIFKNYLAAEIIPSAACGFLWCESTENLEKCISAAEILMYEDKRHFYLDHPEYNHRH